MNYTLAHYTVTARRLANYTLDIQVEFWYNIAGEIVNDWLSNAL